MPSDESSARGDVIAAWQRTVRMPDGAEWLVFPRHEMAQVMSRRTLRERAKYLMFAGPGDAWRRIQVNEAFPADASAAQLVALWERAAVLPPPDRQR